MYAYNELLHLRKNYYIFYGIWCIIVNSSKQFEMLDKTNAMHIKRPLNLIINYEKQ